MTNKELKKLTRTELLELLLAQTRRADDLEKEVESLKAELSKREIDISNSGSIAEAALRLNDVFEAAQAAADQYLANVKRPSVIYEKESTRYTNYFNNTKTNAHQYNYERYEGYNHGINRHYQPVPKYTNGRVKVYNIKISGREYEE